MKSNVDLLNGNRIGYTRIPYISMTLKEYKEREQEMLQLLQARKGNIQKIYQEKSVKLETFDEMCDGRLKRGDTLVIANLFVLGDSIKEQIERLSTLGSIGVDLEICDMDVYTKTDSQIEVLQKLLMNIEKIAQYNKAPRKKGRPELQYPENADDIFYLVISGELNDNQAMEKLKLKRDKYYDFKRLYRQKCNDAYRSLSPDK